MLRGTEGAELPQLLRCPRVLEKRLVDLEGVMAPVPETIDGSAHAVHQDGQLRFVVLRHDLPRGLTLGLGGHTARLDRDAPAVGGQSRKHLKLMSGRSSALMKERDRGRGRRILMFMRSPVALALGLALAAVAVSACGRDEDPTPHPQVSASGSPVRLVSQHDADLVLYVSNQSFEDGDVGLKLTVDGVTVVDGEFHVKGQRNWILFPLDLLPGRHTLSAESDSGASLTESFEVPGDEPRYAVVDYWTEGDEPEFTWNFQREPVGFA